MPPGNPAALGDAILRLADEPSLARALATAAQAHVREAYDFAAFMDRLEGVYEACRGEVGAVSEDLLEALLRAALAEGALDAASLPRFAEALRARAALVLAERVLPIEERAAAFETESAWRAEVMASFDAEKKAWQEETRTWQEAHARLAADREAQVAEVRRAPAGARRARRAAAALAEEREALLEHQRRCWRSARR